MGWCASITLSIRSSTASTRRCSAPTGRPSGDMWTMVTDRCRFRSRSSACPASRCGPTGHARICWATWKPGRRAGRCGGRWGPHRSRRSGASSRTPGAPAQHLDPSAGRSRCAWAGCKAVTRAGPTAFSDPTFAAVSPRKRTTPHSGPSELAAPFRTSEDVFRLMVENVKDYAIFMLDVRGRVASWNAGAERIKGYSAKEIIGQHFSRFYPPEDVQARKPERELQVAAAEGQWADEGWRVRKDGSRFWASVGITPLPSAAGELLGFGKRTRDITQRHEMERALRETDQRFRLIVEGAKDYALLMLDPEGRVVSWNAGAERLKGRSEERRVGKECRSRWSPYH